MEAREEYELLFHKRAGFSLFFSLKSNTLSVSAPPSTFPFYLTQLIEASAGPKAEPHHSPGSTPWPHPQKRWRWEEAGTKRARPYGSPSPASQRARRSGVGVPQRRRAARGCAQLETVVTPPACTRLLGSASPAASE